jgi:hypothetical protein
MIISSSSQVLKYDTGVYDTGVKGDMCPPILLANKLETHEIWARKQKMCSKSLVQV